MKKILILTANPTNTSRLRLDEEVREIQAALDQSKKRDQFEIITRWAVRVDDLQPILLDYEPQIQIVHFSGHGGGSQGLALENELGQMQLVSSTALAGLFKLFKASVECVFLNACYSEEQAKAIYQHINCVVGMNQAIGDKAAIKFAKGFYRALGTSKTYKEAFEFGCNAIDLQSIPESSTPVIKLKKRSRAASGKRQPAQSDALQLASNPTTSSGARSRIFISYKRGVSPDEAVALDVFQALSQYHDVFIDQTMTVGTPWAERIEQELRQSDFLISFLTSNSVSSEMVRGEIETAHHLRRQHGKPVILPIRLAYRDPFTYPLSAYLNGINWAFWENPADTPRLIQELMQAIAGNALSINTDCSKADLTNASDSRLLTPSSLFSPPLPSAQPLSLEMPEGTIDPESKFYVERTSDAIALNAIQRQGVTISIKGPRQMGKSSLLIQVVDAAVKASKRVAFLDFQFLDRTILDDAGSFFRQFCEWVTNQLELPDRVEEYWQSQSGRSQCCTRYMQNYILKELGSPLLLAMDEVDRVFETQFQSDFFGMLRGWHNSRALPTTRIWRNLDLALVTATEPYHLIENLNQSPFNVGEVITLEDFTRAQVADLNQRHGSPLSPSQEQQLMEWVNGHPYLVRRALYLVASQQYTVENLFAQAISERGPFGDHLRYHLFRISDRRDLVQGLRQVIQNQTCRDDRVLRLLSAAGLVNRDKQAVLPRCRLYAEFFRERLHG